MKEKLLKAIRILIVLFVTLAISKGLRVVASILEGEHGAPSFATPAFTAFGVVSQLALIIAYILIGYQIPTKSKLGKGLIFTTLFWASDYIAQILGMTGAESTIISADALSTKTILLDSAGYLVGGAVMGLLLTFKKADGTRSCKQGNLRKASLISMLVFPGILFLLEMLMGVINADFLSCNAFGILSEDKLPFYLVFYLFQAVSGLLFPVFYRYTEFNSTKKQRWLRFATIYGWLLWSPIVLIVGFFGAEWAVTIAFAGIMVASIYIDTYIYGKILEKE